MSETPLSLYPIRWEFGYLNTACLVLLNWNAPVYEFLCEIRKEFSQIPIESSKEFKKRREAQRKLCSDRGKAHSAHRWTLSDHPIRCKTTDRFPPTTHHQPKTPQCAPVLFGTHTDSLVPSPSALQGFATGLCAFYVQTTRITVKQQLKKRLLTVTHLSWLVGKVFPIQTMDTGSLEWST